MQQASICFVDRKITATGAFANRFFDRLPATAIPAAKHSRHPGENFFKKGICIRLRFGYKPPTPNDARRRTILGE